MRSITVALVLLVGLTSCGAFCSTSQAQRSPGATEKSARISLVREFIREMEALYRLQETSKKEFAEDSSASGKLVTSIRVGTRTLFEMRDSINRLDLIGVVGQPAEIKELLKGFHDERVKIVSELIQMTKTVLSGPAPGVNFGAMAGRLPELTAHVEQIDKSMFTIAQPLFYALVDEGRTSADGNLHHLILTKNDRAAMIKTLDTAFDGTVDDKNATSVVSAAWAIKYGITRPIYKSADEP